MNEDWETRVQQTTKKLPYPATPDIAARLRQPRRGISHWQVAQVAATVLIVLLGLLTVPEIRAQVIAFLRIGAVEFVVTTATPPAAFDPDHDLPGSVLDFPGETTLADAQQHAGYPIALPRALGASEHVYLIQAVRPIVVLVWLNASGAVDASLHLLPPRTYSVKLFDGTLEETQVNGEWAVWLSNPHLYLLRIGTGDYDTLARRVTMHALVWEAADGITYRLETDRSLEEARIIAESVPVGNG